MGIFTRVKDIINSNINAMLSKAEDPEKLIRLMIQEMEDTLVEVKSSCAGAIASRKKLERELKQVEEKGAQWEDRARLAVDKGREDLAREALLEKRRFTERLDLLRNEQLEADDLVKQYQKDIEQLEEKICRARDKQRMLVQRHIHADRKKKAQTGIRKMEVSDTLVKIDQFENRIERMEAEADLV
ncbi:MAG: PspA/IM30 family protein, partial [Verrucomicrobiota bacterium]